MSDKHIVRDEQLSRLSNAVMQVLLLAFGIVALPALATGRFYNPTWDTVMDTATQRLWEARGTGERQTLRGAQHYCATLSLGGYDDWRLPHIKELASLVDESSYNPSVYPYFQTESSTYWSTTSLALPDDKRFSWTLNFSDGHMHAFRHDNGYFVRCVRNAKPVPPGQR